MTPMMTLAIVILILLLVSSGLFSGSETAITSLDEFEVEKMKREGWKNAEIIEELKRKPEDTLTAILIGNNLVNVASSALATYIIVGMFGKPGLGIATGIMTFMILIFGEITPKTFCVTHAKTISVKIAKPLMLFTWILSPVSHFLQRITGALLSVIGVEKESKQFSEEDLKLLVAMGGKQGTIKRTEEKMVKNVLELDEVPVKDIMTPKEEVVELQQDKEMGEVRDFLEETPYSRIPLYEGKQGDVRGILLVKKALKNKKDKQKLIGIAEKPLFLDSNTKIDQALREFKRNKIHMAIVKDEKVKGIVTLEDVLEEIVGEIEDETDHRAIK